MVMPRLAAIILNRSQIGSSTMIAVLLLGLKGASCSRGSWRLSYAVRASTERGPPITLSTSHATDSSYLHRDATSPRR